MMSGLATIMQRSQKRTRDVKSLGAKRVIQTALRLKGGMTPSDKGLPSRGTSDRTKADLPRRRLLDDTTELACRASGLDPRVADCTVPCRSIPDKATFSCCHHDGAHGALDYRLYRPRHHGSPFRGVVLMLHGCTQSPEEFAVGTGMNAHAARNGLIVVYPEQTWSYTSANCWSWFRPGDQGRSGGEPALLAELVLGRDRAAARRPGFAEPAHRRAVALRIAGSYRLHGNPRRRRKPRPSTKTAAVAGSSAPKRMICSVNSATGSSAITGATSRIYCQSTPYRRMMPYV